MFFEHADCLIGICKDVDTCSSQVLTLDLTKYDEIPQTNNAVDNDDDEFVGQNATGHGHYHDDSHVVDSNGHIADFSPRGSSNRDDDYEEGVVVASSSGGDGCSGSGGGAKGCGSTRSVKERRSSSSKRKSNESGGGSKMIYREVIVEETEADVEENDG